MERRLSVGIYINSNRVTCGDCRRFKGESRYRAWCALFQKSLRSVGTNDKGNAFERDPQCRNMEN